MEDVTNILKLKNLSISFRALLEKPSKLIFYPWFQSLPNKRRKITKIFLNNKAFFPYLATLGWIGYGLKDSKKSFMTKSICQFFLLYLIIFLLPFFSFQFLIRLIVPHFLLLRILQRKIYEIFLWSEGIFLYIFLSSAFVCLLSS